MSANHDSHDSHQSKPADIIPENSLQDKLLSTLAAFCLASLIMYGLKWANMPICGHCPASSEMESHCH